MKYRRLPGRQWSLIRHASLWLGQDHLLAVQAEFHIERYRRYYFQDIQALLVRRTARGRIINGVLAVLAALPGGSAIVALSRGDSPTALILGLVAASFLLLLAANVLFGPTCACDLQMPLGTHPLPSLRRLRTVGKVLAKMRPLIEQVQGSLPREEIAARSRALTEEAAIVGSYRPEPFPAAQPTRSVSSYGGGVHLALFLLLLVESGLSLWHLYESGPLTVYLNLVSGAALFVLIVVALARQMNSGLPGPVRVWTWVTLGNVLANYVLGSIFFVVYFLNTNLQAFADQGRRMAALTELRPADHPFLAGLLLVYVALALIAALLGLTALARHRRRPSKIPAA